MNQILNMEKHCVYLKVEDTFLNYSEEEFMLYNVKINIMLFF
jgi:hypothetical protein